MSDKTGLGGDIPIGTDPPKAPNEFEQVDAAVADAMTVAFSVKDGTPVGRVSCPKDATGGKLPLDYNSGLMPAKDALRGAIKLANDLKVAIVVVDPENVWQPEWGVLYRVIEDDEPA